MPEESSPKLSAPVPIMLRLDDVLDQRLKAAAQKTGLGRQDIIRAGLSHELARIELPRPAVAPEIAQAIDRARLYGVDVLAALSRAVEDATLSLAARESDPEKKA